MSNAGEQKKDGKKEVVRVVALSDSDYNAMMEVLSKGEPWSISGRDQTSEPCELRDGKPFEKNTKQIFNIAKIRGDGEKEGNKVHILSNWGRLIHEGYTVTQSYGPFRTIVKGNTGYLFNIELDTIVLKLDD